MIIVDAHLDLSWNALQWNRDLTQAVYTLRTREATTPGKGRAQNTVAFPDLQRGRIALCFGTLLARSTGHPVAHVDYDTPEQAYAVTQGQLAYYNALAQRGTIRLLYDIEALDSHIAEWQAWENTPENPAPPLGMIISMESADSILTPEQIPQWYAQGLRLIGPAHYGMGRYAGGTSVEDGLTPLGVELLKQMDSAGMILDLTHLSDKAFWQAMDIFNGVVIASHNNCRALVPHQRQFDDDQIKAIAARNGVLGMALDTWMLVPGWVKGVTTNTGTSLTQIADHVDYICQLTGSSAHVGIGSDLDGGFGREQSPADLDTIADLQKLIGILAGRGYTETDIAAVMHGNWLNLLRRAWKNG